MGGGGGGKGGGSSTSTQKTEPWDEQKGYLKGLMQVAASTTGGGYYDEKNDIYVPFQGENGLKGTMYAPDYYPGETVAGMDPFTRDAIGRQASRAVAGSPYNNAAGSQLGSTLAGDYLNSPIQRSAQDVINGMGQIPDFLQSAFQGGGAQADISAWEGGQNGYLDDMVGRAQKQSLANTAASFSGAGRYGSGSHEAAANDAAGNIATQMYGEAYNQDQNRDLQAWQGFNDAKLQNANLANQASMQGSTNMLNAYLASQSNGLSAMNMLQGAYDKERGNMMNAMGFAPTLANESYKDIAALSEAGAARQGYEQSLINADIDRWNYDQSVPLTALQNYAAMISGNYGGTSTAKSSGAQASGNPLGGVMSGALGGAALGGMTGIGSGYGAAGGGLMGLLSGLM